MKSISRKQFFKNEVTEKIIILLSSMILIYFLITTYFNKHFFFNTVINGVNVSLKAYHDVDYKMISYAKDYELHLIDRYGKSDVITAQKIGMQYNEKNSISKIYRMQNSFQWIKSLFKRQKYYVNDLYSYHQENLENEINQLDCLNKDIVEPRNVSFLYLNGSYEIVGEENGNKINKEKLFEAIRLNILKGKTELDLDETDCYEKPKYTLSSDKALQTLDLLNKMVSTKITYKFGYENVILDGDIINKWLSVDEELEVVINKTAVMNYIDELSFKYDTVGRTRNFKTSTDKIIEVKGGLYGWKINQKAEEKALIDHINLGEVIEKEPTYAQMALVRGEDDLGNTYVEINITKQHLWFYKDGTLLAHGPVVTGNPNKGNSTVVGTFMLNYKREGETISGRGYEVKVTYWMPFYGNIGLHDASWRSSFGGEIYKRNGTHGCVNAPLYLAKIVYENIEDGVPIICYKE